MRSAVIPALLIAAGRLPAWGQAAAWDLPEAWDAAQAVARGGEARGLLAEPPGIQGEPAVITGRRGGPVPSAAVDVVLAAPAPPDPGPGAPLSFGRCALGPVAACHERLLFGLAPEDRRAVTLDGRAVRVDPGYASASPNFAALRQAALQDGPPTLIEVLSPEHVLTIKTFQRWPAATPEAVPMRMGSPGTNDGFEGYTFFPYRGRHEEGIIHSAGPYTLVAVNTDQSPVSLTEALHHELRHVLLGGFGRAPLKARHGQADVDRATREAQDEARRHAGPP